MATSAQIRQQLVEALELDLIGPGWDDVARRHERLPQPPSIWYTTGFLVPNSFQEEAGKPPEGDAPSNADQGGEDPSNDAAICQEEREGDDDASGSQEESSSKRNWFPSSAGLSLIVEKGSEIEVVVTWEDYRLSRVQTTRAGAGNPSGRCAPCGLTSWVPAPMSPWSPTRKACVCVGSPGAPPASSATRLISTPSRCSC